MKQICRICKKVFNVKPAVVKYGYGKYCSNKCRYKSYEGKPSWNKGTKGICKPNKGSFKKGRRPSIKTEFTKGNIPWNKGKKRPEITAGKHPNWKGGKVERPDGYIGLYCLEHPSACNGYVLEHRVVMEKHLGRLLNHREIVHHINGVRNDNRIENLKYFTSQSLHQKFEIKDRKVKTHVNC